jgi:hypothetical protein
MFRISSLSFTFASYFMHVLNISHFSDTNPSGTIAWVWIFFTFHILHEYLAMFIFCRRSSNIVFFLEKSHHDNIKISKQCFHFLKTSSILRQKKKNFINFSLIEVCDIINILHILITIEMKIGYQAIIFKKIDPDDNDKILNVNFFV